MVIRLQIYSTGTARVFVEKTPFDKTTLLLTKQSTVSAEAVNRFLECVKRGDFWQLPTQEHEQRVVDGSYWVLEGVRDGNYHLVYRRAPELKPGAFTDISRNLAKDLAGLGFCHADCPLII